MRSAHIGLAAMLAVQLAVAAVLLAGNQRVGSDQVAVSLLAGGSDGIDRVVITDGDGVATLVRNSGVWVLPELDGMPVNAAGLGDVIDRLAAIRTDWPVASTAASHERFQVADDGFQRRVQLFRGEDSAGDFYLGTSPGYRQVHLRRAGEDAVYAVKLNTHDLPARDADWMDKKLLAIPDPVKIEGEDYVIQASGEDAWKFAEVGPADGGQPGETLDADRARQLVAALANLRVLAIADEPPALGKKAGDSHLLIVESDGGTSEFWFQVIDGKCYVKRDDLDTVFTLSQYDYDRIVGVTRADLAAATAQPDSQQATPPEFTAE